MTLALAEAERNTKNVTEQMRKYFSTIALLLPIVVCAQNVHFHEPEALKIALEQKISATDSSRLDGFRIQIFSGSSRANAEKVKDQLIHELPEFSNRIYLKYQAPNYKIRVGNYYHEIDAQKDLKILESKYEGIFVVREQIRLPKR